MADYCHTRLMVIFQFFLLFQGACSVSIKIFSFLFSPMERFIWNGSKE